MNWTGWRNSRLLTGGCGWTVVVVVLFRRPESERPVCRERQAGIVLPGLASTLAEELAEVVPRHLGNS